MFLNKFWTSVLPGKCLTYPAAIHKANCLNHAIWTGLAYSPVTRTRRTMQRSPAVPVLLCLDARIRPRQRSRRSGGTLGQQSTRSRPWETGLRIGTQRTRHRARPKAAGARGCTPQPSAASPLCSSSCWPLRWARAVGESGSPYWPASPCSSLARCAWPQLPAAAERPRAQELQSSACACTSGAPGCCSAAFLAPRAPGCSELELSVNAQSCQKSANGTRKDLAVSLWFPFP